MISPYSTSSVLPAPSFDCGCTRGRALGSVVISLSPNQIKMNPTRSIKKLLSLGLLASFGGCLTLTAETLQINFGDPVTETGWNNASSSAAVALVDASNAATDATISITSPFNSINRSGSTVAVGDFPASVTATSQFGNTSTFGGGTFPNPAFEITGLDGSTSYDLTIFASRMSVTDIRTTTYTVTGANTVEGELDASNNTTNTLTISGATPSAEGKITVALAPAASNTNATGFIYLSGLIISNDGTSADPTWGGFPIVDNRADTGDWLGIIYVYPESNWIYVYNIENFVYLPAPGTNVSGAWGYAVN